MSETNIEPILKIELGLNGTLSFFDTEEIADWYKAQRSFYEPFTRSNSGNNVRSDLYNQLQHDFSNIEGAIAESNQSHRLQAKDRFHSVKARIENVFAGNRLPTAGSPRGKIIAHLFAQNNIDGAAYAAAFFLGRQLQLQNPDGIKGLFTAVLAELGSPKLDAPVADALKVLYKDWSTTLAESKQTEAQLKADHEKEIATQRDATTMHQGLLNAALKDTSDKLSDKLTDVENQLAAKLKNTEDRLAAVEKTYDEKLALQSAVTYWEDKATSHKWWAVVWGVFSVIAAIAATWFTLNSVKQTLGTTRIADAQLSQISELALIAIFGVWLMRVLVRLMLSNTHLHTDASERKTMMLTYLAMMREKQLPEGNSRDLILQALFRPTSTGIIKDDASPPFMAEWLKCTVGKE